MVMVVSIVSVPDSKWWRSTSNVHNGDEHGTHADRVYDDMAGHERGLCDIVVDIDYLIRC